MSKVCEVCGKGPVSGNRIIRKGLEKKKGGIGLHTTGVTPRRFLPNLQKVKIKERGATVTRRICMACLKGDKVVKA